jgi:hypothetical protein
LIAREQAAADKMADLEDAIEKKTDISILALAAHMMILIRIDDEEDYVLRTFRAALVAIRPQLVGEIADDTDRILAQDQEERA